MRRATSEAGRRKKMAARRPHLCDGILVFRLCLVLVMLAASSNRCSAADPSNATSGGGGGGGFLRALLLPEEAGLANTSDCLAALNTIGTEAFYKGTPWALAIVDAAGKLGSGLLQGAASNPGNMEECLATRIPPESGIPSPSRLKFCRASLAAAVAPGGEEGGDEAAIVPLPPGLALVQGVCVPALCSAGDLTDWANSVTAPWGILANVAADGCVTSSSSSAADLTTTQVALLALLAVVAALVVLGTALDVCWTRRRLRAGSSSVDRGRGRGRGARSLLAFSLVSNTESLLDTAANNSKGAVRCLHGIRFLSMTWVILGHTYNVLFYSFPVLSNPADVFRMLSGWPVVVVTNGTVSVDTFFTMSGLLVSYLLLKEMARSRGRFDALQYYLHRYIRLTPMYAMMICVFVAVFPLLGSTQLFRDVFSADEAAETCGKWWSNLVYVNNLVDGGTRCLGQAWYLANDMQFYALAPLVVVPLHRLGREGLKHAYLGFWLVAAAASTAAVLVAMDVTGVISAALVAGLGRGNNNVDYYIKPWCRFGPYVVGIYAGYLLHVWRDGDGPRLPRWLVACLWASAAATNLAVLYGLTDYFTLDDGDIFSAKVVPVAVDVWYTSLHRTAWAAGVAWVVLACHWGYGGPVNALLSWRALVPLSKLTYACFLVHPYVQILRVMNAKSLWHVDTATVTFDFLAYLVLTYLVSYAAAMMFEFPVMKLEKVWLFPTKNDKPLPDRTEPTANNTHLHSPTNRN